MLLRTFDEIYQWASTKDPDEIVGVAQNGTQCPLAKCHDELDEMKDCLMWHFGDAFARSEGRIFSYPRWMVKVMENVDALPERYEVKARVFLAILKSVKQWEGIVS